MAKNYRTAMGKKIDLDQLQLANESVIAIGNMKVNARGDKLGPGGKVVKTKREIMNDYHKIKNGQVAQVIRDVPEKTKLAEKPVQQAVEQEVQAQPEPAPSETTKTKPRGSFADAIAEETERHTELLEPATRRSTDGGLKRI